MITREVTGQIASKRFNQYSQFGEDGIIEEIFRRIGAQNKWCLDAGATDGLFFSNTRRLIERGWTGVLIESDARKFERLKINALGNSICENVAIEPLGVNSLDNILRRHNAPMDIDLVSLDIDGQEYYVWNSSLSYAPRVVVIEYRLPDDDPDIIPIFGGEGQAGSRAIETLAAGKGYKPIIKTPSNVICVRNDAAHKLINSKE